MAIRRQPWGPEMTEEDYLLQAQQNRANDPLASFNDKPIGNTTTPPTRPQQDFPLPPGDIQDVPPPPPPPGPSDFGGGDPNQQKRQISDARGGRAPLGFQQNKWNNQDWNTTKYRGGTILAGGGGIQDVLADPMFKDWTQVDEDEIKSPTGNVYDLFYDYDGPNQRVQWTQTGFAGSDPRLNDNIKGNFAAQEHPNRNAPASYSLQDWDDFLGAQGGGGGRSQPMGNGQGMQGNVGQDPFSNLLTGGIGNLIARGGANQFGLDVNATLADVINESAWGPNEGRMNSRLETLRENAGLAQRAMANDARGSLASRGLLSEPGMPQGPEISAMTRISEQVAIPFAQGLRDAQVEESQLADQRLMQGLGLATDQSQAQSSNLLGALSEGTNRQNVLAQIALGALDRNIVWNRFLANYGLDRERLAHEIQQGRIQNVQQILELFARYVDMARQGQVGS